MDLLLFYRGWRIGIEIKRADAPTMTASMHTAFSDLKLDRLFVVYPGKSRYLLSGGLEVLPLQDCIDTPDTSEVAA